MREVGLAPVDLGCLVCAGTWVLIAWDARGIIERSKIDLLMAWDGMTFDP